MVKGCHATCDSCGIYDMYEFMNEVLLFRSWTPQKSPQIQIPLDSINDINVGRGRAQISEVMEVMRQMHSV